MSISQTNPDQLRFSDDDEGRIIQVDAERRPEAIERLVASGPEGDPAHARRFLRFARANGIQLDALWSMLDGRGRIRWSALAVPSPGRTAMIFASHPDAPAARRCIATLIDHACRALTTMDVHLAQALLEPAEEAERQTLLSAGFSELAHLSYLERPLKGRPRLVPPRWPAGVTVQTFTDDLEDELVRILDETYIDTLDCPGLMGLRDTPDILAGHRATGRFDPALWTILRLDGAGVGTLLLNPSPGSKQIELVYLGLAPAARGRGLGRELLRHGLALLASRPERSVTLAVDERNAPALALYQREGFRRVLRRVALVRSVRG